MALRTYWCVISQRGKTFWGNPTFRQVAQFSCDLDLEEGMEYTARAAFFYGVRQAGGDESDAGDYRMDVYASAGDGQPLLPEFTVPPDVAMHRPAGSLADYGDDELISELAWRLRGRG